MPKSLKVGSRLAIIAPAGRVFKKEIEFAVDWLRENQWQAVFSEDLFYEYNFGYFFAGTDEHRLHQTQQALDDDAIDAIWFARGGYGSVRLIDKINFDKFIKKPKWLIGYSDITVFHNAINNMDIPTLHAVTAKQLNTEYSTETYTSLVKVLKGESLFYEIPTHILNQKGKAKGKLVGGNLSMIYSQLGSRTAIKKEESILFIEDWQENWYHLDRMLMALKRSGLFENIKGLIVGSFTKMDIKEENKDYSIPFDSVSNQIILSHFRELNIPICFNFPAGHIGDNRALVLGAEAKFLVDSHSSSLILESK